MSKAIGYNIYEFGIAVTLLLYLYSCLKFVIW